MLVAFSNKHAQLIIKRKRKHTLLGKTINKLIRLIFSQAIINQIILIMKYLKKSSLKLLIIVIISCILFN
jgi:hypothetical protein